jgi:hypothetical protein
LALTSNVLRPRRTSTVYVQAPVESAVVRYGSSRPAALISTVAPGEVVPRTVYWVEESSRSKTAAGGSLTAIVGGRANRSSWTARYAPKATTPTVRIAATTMPELKVSP